MKRENVADVVCIGAQKASTSWLHHVLRAHPQAGAFEDVPGTSNGKEAHFWDRNRERGVDWYRTLLTPDDPARKSLDFTPAYALLEDADIAECKALSPTARIVYVVRDPLARAVSALRMFVRRRHPDAPAAELRIPFDAATRKLARRVRILEHSRYVANHERWARHYDEILVVGYEEILADAPAVARRVLDFVGLDPQRLSLLGRARLARRSRRNLWRSRRYALDPELVDFLHASTWEERKAAEEHFGLRFEEYREVLAASRP